MANYIELIGLPEILTLPDGRKRVTRRYTVKAPGAQYANLGTPSAPGAGGVYLAWGTADAEHTGARLIKQDLAPASQLATEQVLVRVYEELPASAELQVGSNQVTYDANGRKTIAAQFLQFASAAFVPGTVGTTTAPSDTACVLQGVQASDDGTLRTIARSYLEATAVLTQVGGTSQSLDDNGRRTAQATFIQLTSATYVEGTIGTTAAPGLAACVLAGETKQENAAVRTVVRSYVEATALEVQVGADEITADENGRRTITRRFIQLSSAVYVQGTIGASLSALSTTFALTSEQKSETTVVRSIARRWVEATTSLVQVGSDAIDTEINGLRRRTQVFIGTAAAADPTGTIGTTTHDTDTTLILASKKVERTASFTRAQLVWIQPGILSKHVQSRDLGLRMESWTSIGVKQSPTGVVVSEDTGDFAGLPTWTVVAMQNLSGGAPTSGSYAYDAMVPFTYPGRAKPIELIESGKTCYDVFLSPPVECDVLARVTVSYQTADTIGELTYPLWNPTEWATLTAQWTGWNAYPRVKVEGLRGYRAENNYSKVAFTPVDGFAATCFGDRVYGGTDGVIIVSGGPGSPDGLTLTLQSKLDVAFVDKDGVRYFRLTLVTATIPAQAALPIADPPALITGVTNKTTLAAVVTVGVAVGTRTNYFYFSWTPGGGIMINQLVRGVLRAGTDANSTFIQRPDDHNASTNAKVWALVT